MKGNKTAIFLLTTVSFLVLSAHDLATHIYIGSRTHEVWRDFDYNFYAHLTGPEDNTWAVLTRKFYYIGLTLPDMFLSLELGDFDMQGMLRKLA